MTKEEVFQEKLHYYRNFKYKDNTFITCPNSECGKKFMKSSGFRNFCSQECKDIFWEHRREALGDNWRMLPRR